MVASLSASGGGGESCLLLLKSAWNEVGPMRGFSVFNLHVFTTRGMGLPIPHGFYLKPKLTSRVGPSNPPIAQV